jgi:FkbM family methyltransferase
MTSFTTEIVQAEIDGFLLKLPKWRADFYDARPDGWEAPRIASMAKMVKPGMTVIDVGAECGDFTALYKSWVGGRGTVAIVEPQVAYWPLIRQIWEANFTDDPGPCFVGFASDNGDPPSVEAAVANPITLDCWPDVAGGAGIPELGFCHLAQQTDTIAQTMLDDLAILGRLQVDAIVIDVEGAELRVLRGAEGILRVHRPNVWVSLHPPTMLDWYDCTPEDIDAFMDDCGYDSTYLGETTEIFQLYTPKERP